VRLPAARLRTPFAESYRASLLRQDHSVRMPTDATQIRPAVACQNYRP
jgi:hypothetical protein